LQIGRELGGGFFVLFLLEQALCKAIVRRACIGTKRDRSAEFFFGFFVVLGLKQGTG